MTTAYTYQLVRAGSSVVIRSDGALISGAANDPFSADYLAWVAAGNTPTPPATLVSTPQTPQQLAASIDDLVAGIYSNWTRFQAEYDARRQAAQAFKDANYTGDPGVWVTSYATSATTPSNTVTNQQATDTILSQASTLDNALSQLGALRMQKYTVINAADQATAQSNYDSIVAQVKQIAASLS